jgi:hypothetical protein
MTLLNIGLAVRGRGRRIGNRPPNVPELDFPKGQTLGSGSPPLTPRPLVGIMLCTFFVGETQARGGLGGV